MTRACRNCQWWVGEPAGSGGECRGAPPTPVITADGLEAMWPRTGSFEWCGAFRMAERLADGMTDAEFETAHAQMGQRLAGLGNKPERGRQ
jgi:hypothetical protein